MLEAVIKGDELMQLLYIWTVVKEQDKNNSLITQL